jgi:hypothetical protein
MLKFLGRQLAEFLTSPGHSHGASPASDIEHLRRALQPGDVLLVEGSSRVSVAIKYLTQSTWSHAALFVGDLPARDGGPHLIEADAVEGVRAVKLDAFRGYHCRICRPVGLTSHEIGELIAYAAGRLGHTYDLKNIIDLLRYLVPTPPVPVGWRRRMIALGSGDPTRAICSTLIAQAFQSIRYPVLPEITTVSAPTADCPACVEELLRVRHHSLFVPRDFDVSPYFEIVKPTVSNGFDYRAVKWEPERSQALNVVSLKERTHA